MEFLADLFVEVYAGDIQIDSGQGVEINRRIAVVLAPSRDRPEGECITQFDFGVHRQTERFHILDGIVKPTASVVNIAQHRCPGYQTRDQAMAAARITFILGVVTLDAQESGFIVATDFEAQTPSPNVLVVVFEASGEIFSESTAGQARHRSTDASHIANGRGCRQDAFGLIIRAVGRTSLDRGFEREALCHIFDRAADRVAPIQCALRSAQDLDPLNVIYVKDSCLGPIEVHIVKVDAHALFEARYRILLADPANECGERGIGRAARFESHVGNGLRNVCDVERASLGELFAAERRNRDGHVDQTLFAPPSRHDDYIAFFGIGID